MAPVSGGGGSGLQVAEDVLDLFQRGAEVIRDLLREHLIEAVVQDLDDLRERRLVVLDHTRADLGRAAQLTADALVGTVAAGQTVSSAFTLQATDRVLLIGVGSHAALTWWASFQANPGGPFVRYLDSWNTFSGAVFAGTGGAWGMVPYPPSVVCRLETSGAVSATTSFCLVEAHR